MNTIILTNLDTTLASRASGLAGRASGLARWPRGGDGRTDVGKISPFYRTLSPIGAAAQKVAQRHQMVSSFLALLYFLGSGPYRG